MAEIAASIDTTADGCGQVMKSEHREWRNPLDLVLFLQKRLAKGDDQAEIAKELGKSRP